MYVYLFYKQISSPPHAVAVVHFELLKESFHWILQHFELEVSFQEPCLCKRPAFVCIDLYCIAFAKNLEGLLLCFVCRTTDNYYKINSNAVFEKKYITCLIMNFKRFM